MKWKPNTKYKATDGLVIIVDANGKDSTVIKIPYESYPYVIGYRVSVGSWYSDAFTEIKSKVNHLPDWM